MELPPGSDDVVGILRAVRRRAGCSQRQRAERAGVSPSTVGRRTRDARRRRSQREVRVSRLRHPAIRRRAGDG